jgi:Family of unknown function (DUF6009)
MYLPCNCHARYITITLAIEYESMVCEKTLNNEKSICWLENPSDYPWVREIEADFCQKQEISKSRQSQIQKEWKLIGYAELSDDAPSSFTTGNKKYYYRRIFVVRNDDYEAYKNGGYPIEAVDPLTVEAKIKGVSPKKKLKLR